MPEASCDWCGEEPNVSLSRCVGCWMCLCEECYGDPTQATCRACRRKEAANA